jgi:hypothetical protein
VAQSQAASSRLDPDQAAPPKSGTIISPTAQTHDDVVCVKYIFAPIHVVYIVS